MSEVYGQTMASKAVWPPNVTSFWRWLVSGYDKWHVTMTHVNHHRCSEGDWPNCPCVSIWAATGTVALLFVRKYGRAHKYHLVPRVACCGRRFYFWDTIDYAQGTGAKVKGQTMAASRKNSAGFPAKIRNGAERNITVTTRALDFPRWTRVSAWQLP